MKQLNSIEFTSGTILNTAISFSCLPAAFMKSGNADISDAPTGSRTSEFGCIVYGHGARRIVLLTDYGNCATYIRTIFSATWYSDWKISTKTLILNLSQHIKEYVVKYNNNRIHSSNQFYKW